MLPIQKGLQYLTSAEKSKLQEIRLRIEQPVLVKMQNREYGLNERGLTDIEDSIIVSRQLLTDILNTMSDFSFYALEEELKQGFMTLEGGHRVGFVGKVVLENNQIKTMRSISGINIRVAHEVMGCSKRIMPYIVKRNKVYHTLIVSPPNCGKTTLLRDIVYHLSEGYKGYGPYTVGVVDERSEIAACYQGVPQNHLGKRTDVLDGCPKVDGMRMLLRSMSPEVIAVDEIGKKEDCMALEEMLNAGITVICTAHGKDKDDCLKRPYLRALLENGLFERIIILSNRQGPCTVEAILDGTNKMRALV